MKNYTLLLMIMPVFLFGQMADNFDIKFKAKITQRAKMADDVQMDNLPFMFRNYLDPINQNLQHHYIMEDEGITYHEEEFLSRDDKEDWMDLTHKTIIENGERTLYNLEGVPLDTFSLDEDELEALSGAEGALDFLIRQIEFPFPTNEALTELQNNGIDVIEHTPDLTELKFSQQSSIFLDKQDFSITNIDYIDGNKYISQSRFAFFENIGFMKTHDLEVTYLSTDFYVVRTEERYNFEIDEESVNANTQEEVQSQFFPNPADDMFTIYLNNTEFTIEEIIMTELYSGASFSFNGNSTNQQSLYITHVPAGYYSVAIQMNNGETTYKTILIN